MLHLPYLSLRSSLIVAKEKASDEVDSLLSEPGVPLVPMNGPNLRTKLKRIFTQLCDQFTSDLTKYTETDDDLMLPKNQLNPNEEKIDVESLKMISESGAADVDSQSSSEIEHECNDEYITQKLLIARKQAKRKAKKIFKVPVVTFDLESNFSDSNKENNTNLNSGPPSAKRRRYTRAPNATKLYNCIWARCDYRSNHRANTKDHIETVHLMTTIDNGATSSGLQFNIDANEYISVSIPN